MSAIKDEWLSEDGSVRLILGDCLEVLPTLSGIDAVVTDPPYGIGFTGSNASTMKWDAIVGDDQEMDLRWMLNMECLVVSFGANNYPGQLPHRGRWICWDKRLSIEADRMLGSAFELAWMNRTSGFDRMYRVLHGGVLIEGIPGRRVHPTQKPVGLMVAILRDYTKSNDVICDPFMGSGTTGMACIRLGRKFIGIEIERKYYAIAKRRIQAELERFPLFEPQKPKQLELLP